MVDDQEEYEIECTALHSVAQSGSVSLIQEAIRERPELVQYLEVKVLPFGATPLRLAATGGSASAVNILLDHGAQIDSTDLKQQTPLFVAIKQNHLDCAEVLLRRGANPNGSNGNLSTPLYWATSSGFTTATKLLLRYGADPELYHRLAGIPGGYTCDASTILNYGQSIIRTPLYISVVYGHLDCFMVLLAGGAEPDLRRLTPPLPEKLFQDLSLAHAMVKHLRVKEFIPLFALFGGYFWQKDATGNLAVNLPMDASSHSITLQFMEKPLQLQEVCRIAIRRALGRNRLSEVKGLQLPKVIEEYLLCKDIIPTECLIYA